MAKLRRSHEFAKTRCIRLFGWLCGCEQYRGHEGDTGSEDALHFTVLPKDRRTLVLSREKLRPCSRLDKDPPHVGPIDRKEYADKRSRPNAKLAELETKRHHGAA